MRLGMLLSCSAFLLFDVCGSTSLHAATLSSSSLRVNISDKTGQVTAISEANRTILGSNVDRYDFDGKTADEAADQVKTQRREQGALILDCINEKIGLKIRKRYLLKHGLLEKQSSYTATDGPRRLLKISSQSALSPQFFNSGFYYVPTDDGYKVQGVPVVPGSDIKEPTAWVISTGQFVYSQPSSRRTFAHYRYQINDGYIYGEADRAIESKFVPGGAITALGEDFVDARSQFRLTGRFVLLKGDPRDYHRHIVSQPPYSNYRKSPVPKWFPRARMFFGDGITGVGKGLIEDREAVAADIKSMLKIVPGNDPLMVFFNHWSTSGDYPYRGTFRYLTYLAEGWSKPVPIEKLKENIRWLKAISPRIKVGGYFFISPAEGTYPVTNHPEWFVYSKDLKIEAGGDGIGWCGVPDMSSGYREYLLDQMQHAVTDLGFDWVHIDATATENVNWKTKQVVQTAEWGKFYDALAKYYDPRDKAIVQNVASTIGLWADGSYDECQQPDRWDESDWRILAVPDYLSGLYRTHRPNTWQNLVYGTSGAYGRHNAFAGMRGWIRNASSWWRLVPQGLAYEEIVDELLRTKESGVSVQPSWWRNETKTLEAEVWQRGSALIVPMMRHADKAGTETIKMSLPQRLGSVALKPGQLLFGTDYLLSPATPLNAFEPVPMRMDLTNLIGLQTIPYSKAAYSHRVQLLPLRNQYHVLTPVPAAVYSANGKRLPFLLPETQGIKIDGSALTGAQRYSLTITSPGAAEIVAYLPNGWSGASISGNNRRVASSLISVAGKKAVLFKIGRGRTPIVVAAQTAKNKSASYVNPTVAAWPTAAERVFYSNLTHRAFAEKGMSVLEVQEINKGGGGLVDLRYVQPEKAGGISLQVKGTGSGRTLILRQYAGDLWTYQIKDDFTGWKRFDIYRDQMQTEGAERKWEPTVTVHVFVNAFEGQPLSIANLHLLPARPGDIVEVVKTKRRLTIPKVTAAPKIDGRPDDEAWATAPVQTDFLQMGGNGKISPSITKVRACYDDENLYVLFDNAESIEAAGAPQARDSQIWNVDHVELYLQPKLNDPTWFHLLVDPAGTIEDLKWSKSGQDAGWNGDFEVRTSLNWKASWVAEFKIPFKMLGTSAPKSGEMWGINFGRKDNANEWSNWAAPGEWLDPAGFGEAAFSAGEGK